MILERFYTEQELADIIGVSKDAIISMRCNLKKKSKTEIPRFKKNLTGTKFNGIEVIGYDHEECVNGRYVLFWKCRCHCGNEFLMRSGNIHVKENKSCGCLKHELIAKAQTKHGMHGTRLHRIWCGMNTRCKDEQIYGVKGISVCDEWSFENENGFMNFYEWSMENGYSDELSIDRIDGHGNYEPSNCRWADWKTQSNNRDCIEKYEFQCEMLSISEIERRTGFYQKTLWQRIKKQGMTLEEALNKPLRKSRCKKSIQLQ